MIELNQMLIWSRTSSFEKDDPENIVYLRQIEMGDKAYSMKGLVSVFIEALEGNSAEI